jgi:hypothetical protein
VVGSPALFPAGSHLACVPYHHPPLVLPAGGAATGGARKNYDIDPAVACTGAQTPDQRRPIMDQIRCYGDERLVVSCVYCGNGPIETRDHVPSRILLDDPFPENLPIVPACSACNQDFSLDEEYLACLVECIVCGSTDPRALRRPKVARRLAKQPKLAALLERAHSRTGSASHFCIDEERVKRIVAKLARGHAAFELHEPQVDRPDSLMALPIPLMAQEQIFAFEKPPSSPIWPEVGSRAMSRLVEGGDSASTWIEVQPGRYRYLAAVTGGSTIVRIVLSEYLAGEAIWSSSS